MFIQPKCATNAREPTMHRVGLDVNAASDSITEGALMWILVS